MKLSLVSCEDFVKIKSVRSRIRIWFNTIGNARDRINLSFQFKVKHEKRKNTGKTIHVDKSSHVFF